MSTSTRRAYRTVLRRDGVRVAVTGASGFVGRAVCRHLMHAGVQVAAFGRRHHVPAEHVAGAVYRSWDLTTGRLPDPPAVDTLVHAGAYADAPGGVYNVTDAEPVVLADALREAPAIRGLPVRVLPLGRRPALLLARVARTGMSRYAIDRARGCRPDRSQLVGHRRPTRSSGACGSRSAHNGSDEQRPASRRGRRVIRTQIRRSA